MAHRLISGESPKCAVPHGHNEFVQVKISKKNPQPLDHKINMVSIFEKVKTKWHAFIDNHLDQALQVSDQDALIDFFKKHEPEKLSRLVVTPGDPTTEMMCACLMSKLQIFLDEQKLGLVCEEIKIVETPTNSVILQGAYAYRSHLPIKTSQKKSSGKNKRVSSIKKSSSASFWWERGDFSINDF